MVRNVAIYARVSTEHEAQLSALENQVQYYDNILAQHPDWKLYKRYIDEGITGTSVKKRTNFLKMLKDAESGLFDLIITREVSRFARNTVDTLQETRKLKKIGVEVYFTEDNIWTFNDEDGELKLTIMATLAQNESKKTSQRVKAGQQISFENGVYYGNGNILGYDKVGNQMIVNEEQAKIVRFIFSSFLNGKGSTEIKYELEKKGCLTSTGLKTWSASYITRVVKNPFYCGTIVYRKSFIPDFLEQKAKINRGEVEQVIIEGKHEPLISKDEFERVQEIINKRSSKIKEKSRVGQGIPKSIWTKKLVCNCGASFNKKLYHKKKDGTKSYCYQCYNQKNFGSKQTRLKKGLDISNACDIKLVQEDKLKLMAKVVFDTIWNDKEQIISMANKLIDENIKEENNNEEIDIEIKEINKKIDNINNKINKLLDLYLAESLSKEMYIKKKEELDNTIINLNNKLELIESERTIPKSTLKEKIEDLKQFISYNLSIDIDKPVADELIDAFVEKIIVKNDCFEWKLNCFDDIIDMDVIKTQNNLSNKVLDMRVKKTTPELDCNTSRNTRKWKQIVHIRVPVVNGKIKC
ncbi:MAG: recombinase family protein [Bacilli bacterium]